MKYLMCGLLLALTPLSGVALDLDESSEIAGLYAKSAAQGLVTKMATLRNSGHEWGSILVDGLPGEISTDCGYKARAGFTDSTLSATLPLGKSIVGSRLHGLYEPIFSRKGAQIHLISMRTTDEGIWVELKAYPALRDDVSMNLNYKLSKQGYMELCDIGPEQKGLVYELGKDLNL